MKDKCVKCGYEPIEWLEIEMMLLEVSKNSIQSIGRLTTMYGKLLDDGMQYLSFKEALYLLIKEYPHTKS